MSPITTHAPSSPLTALPTAGPPDLAAIRTRQQALWASGDDAEVARTIQIVAESLCETADLRAGKEGPRRGHGHRQRRHRRGAPSAMRS